MPWQPGCGLENGFHFPSGIWRPGCNETDSPFRGQAGAASRGCLLPGHRAAPSTESSGESLLRWNRMLLNNRRGPFGAVAPSSAMSAERACLRHDERVVIDHIEDHGGEPWSPATLPVTSTALVPPTTAADPQRLAAGRKILR